MTRELVVEGTPQLAVSVGAAPRGTALTRILAAKGSPGWLVEGPRVTEWRFAGIVEAEGGAWLHGPRAEGRTLADVLALPLPQALPFLARLAAALALLSERAVPWFHLQTDAVIFPAGDGVLFLPPVVFAELRDVRPFGENLATFECLGHPDLSDEARASFAVAACVYRAAAGRFPIDGRDAEEVHEQARKKEIVPPGRLVPELRPEVSALVMAGLGRDRRGAVTLRAWADALAGWATTGATRDLAPAERERILREAQAGSESSARSFRRRMFWQKHWKLVGAIVLGVGVAAAVLGSILSSALAPRVTRGYPPRRVVETFYSSMNTLDHMTMSACVVNGAGRGEINEATTLFVTGRVVAGYEGRSNTISAAEWDAAGRPALTSPQVLYGVTSLSLAGEQGEPSPVYRVSYEKWYPGETPADAQLGDRNALPRTEGDAVVDRVSLRRDRDDWVIFRIERLSTTRLPPPQTLAAPPADTGGEPTPGAR